MTPQLPRDFVTIPLAHRALHDVAQGRPENSRAAIRAAIAGGYGIEIDLQLSADNQALVFHDYDLSRLTDARGPIRLHSAERAAEIRLKYGDGEAIPTLREVLSLVAGQVPLLIELKDQDGAMGPDIGPLEAATAAGLNGYQGPVAVMSFNPHSMVEMARLAPHTPRGLVTSDFNSADWPLSDETCAYLRDIPDFQSSLAAFISHDHSDLANPRVQELRQQVPVLCYTIKSPETEAAARRFADNVTFEGYLAKHPG